MKKYGKKVLIDSLISSIIATIIVYIIIGPYNNEFVKIMQDIAENGIAMKVSIIIFFIILIVYLIINIGKIVVARKK